jgi:hypothetical protein
MELPNYLFITKELLIFKYESDKKMVGVNRIF